MSKLSVLLLAVLCMSTVAFGAGGRSLQRRASAEGSNAVSGTNGQGFASGQVVSTDGEAKAAVTVVAEAQSFVKSDLVVFFKEIANAQTLAECFKHDKGGGCCYTVSSRIRENFQATAVAHANSFAAVKADVTVNGQGKACAGGQAAASAFATSFVKVVIEAIVEAYGYGYYEAAQASVKTQIDLFAKTYAKVNLVACAGNDSEATAMIKAAADAYTSAIVEIFLRLNAQYGCRGTISSNNTEVKKTPTEKTESQVASTGHIKGTGHIISDGYAGAFTDLFENGWRG